MKKKQIQMKLTIIFSILVLLSLSCKKDLCESVYCLNGGICVSGNCDCPSGYYGPHCEYSSAGYNCYFGNCSYTESLATYSTFAECMQECGTSGAAGYNCVNGDCQYVTSNAEYGTLSECSLSCGSQECFSTPYYGAQTCNSGYVAVSPTSCCISTNPYLGAEKGKCYTTCIGAKNDGNTTIVYGTGQEGGGGYSCVNNICTYVSSNGQYTTLSECTTFCGSGECFSTPYYGKQNCMNGYVAVSPTSCCPEAFPYLGSEKGGCYSTCLDAKNDGNTTIVLGTGEEIGGNTGQVLFWTQSDLGCGNIQVSIGNQMQTISSFYQSTPSCGAAGCATFTLSPGNYTFNASCNQHTWTDVVFITKGTCIRNRLYL